MIVQLCGTKCSNIFQCLNLFVVTWALSSKYPSRAFRSFNLNFGTFIVSYMCCPLLDSTCPPKVLRRSQFALKEKKDQEDEGGQDDGSTPKPKAKAKAKGRPRGKGKAAKAKAKGKAKAQTKKGSKAKDDPTQEEEEEEEKEKEVDEIAEPSDNTTPEVPKDDEEKPVPKDDGTKEDCPKDDNDLNKKKQEALTPKEPQPADKTPGPKAKAKSTKKRKAKEVEEAQDHSAGSEPTQPVRQRRKAKGNEGKEAKPASADPAKGEDSKEVEVKGEVGKKAEEGGTCEAKANEKEGEVKAKGKKRVRSDEPATFARRNVPTTSFGKDKWYALRQSFQTLIRPTLKHYSTHEDPWLLSFMGIMII